eukprot:m.1466901 g.1466901  ORF g.1466901 m.1466901 type:complete len:76 (-) comp25138_c0_seq20:2776-3003(-)
MGITALYMSVREGACTLNGVSVHATGTLKTHGVHPFESLSGPSLASTRHPCLEFCEIVSCAAVRVIEITIGASVT